VKNLTPSLLALVVSLVAVGIGGVAVAGEDAPAVPWKKLTFSVEKWLNRVETRIELSQQDTAGATAAAVKAAQGQPLQTEAAKLHRIEIHTTIAPAVGDTVALEKVFWFDPQRENVLFGESRRTGQEEYLRRFRFTRQGVFRFRREPATRGEARLSPPDWSDAKASFYAYSPMQWNCQQILEPSALIYFINRVSLDPSDPLPAYCVFHKRQLYRVTLKNGGRKTADADYQKISGTKAVTVKKPVFATRILLEAVPLGDYEGEAEGFSFLGAKRDVELLFDPATRIPVMIGGHIPGLGHSVMRLRSIEMAP